VCERERERKSARAREREHEREGGRAGEMESGREAGNNLEGQHSVHEVLGRLRKGVQRALQARARLRDRDQALSERDEREREGDARDEE